MKFDGDQCPRTMSEVCKMKEGIMLDRDITDLIQFQLLHVFGISEPIIPGKEDNMLDRH